MTDAPALREFLTSRRAALSPHEVGLPPSTVTRRVPGLRREEVAILAGVSADYYVKLEQGRATNVSEQVLAAIERALRLDELERRHLRSLLQPSAGSVRVDLVEAPQPKVRTAVVTMIESMTIPAVVHGPLLEVLAMNAIAKALFDDFEAMPASERNLAKWMFQNPRAREVYVDWELHAAQMVAILRAQANGRYRARLERLVGELSVSAPDFARHWADYQLHEHTHGVKKFANAIVGDLRLNFQALSFTEDSGHTLIVYSAETGSPSADRLALLSSWSASPRAPSDSPASTPVD